MLAGSAPGRESDDEITVFESLGLAVEDLAAAEYLVRRAARDRHRHDRRVLIPLAEIEAARERIAGAAVRTPLVRLPDTDIWLKLENLQPVSSFKIRGATNAIRAASAEELAGGVVTASAGNMAQGVAWAAREAGVPATIIVPDHAPQTKLDRIEALGGRAIKVPFEQWWQTIVESRFEGVDGLFVHPVRGPARHGRERHDRAGAARGPPRRGHGARALRRRRALDRDRERGEGAAAVGKVYGVDPEPGPALSSAFAGGRAGRRSTTRRRSSTAPARRACSTSMWPYLREALDGAYVASLDETADAVRLLAERVRVIAEGAGALAPAVALLGPRRRREDRLHRLRREHRLLGARADPRGRDARSRIRACSRSATGSPWRSSPCSPDGPAVVFFYPAALTPGLHDGGEGVQRPLRARSAMRGTR